MTNVNASTTTSTQHLSRLVNPVRLTAKHALVIQHALNASRVPQVHPVNARAELTQMRVSVSVRRAMVSAKSDTDHAPFTVVHVKIKHNCTAGYVTVL